MGDISPEKAQSPDWSDSSSNKSMLDGSVQAQAPAAARPRLPSRKSSGTMIISRDADPLEFERHIEADDVRAMSPRRSSEDIESLGKEARDELEKHAKALQESLIVLFNRIEAVKEEHDKLDNHNKFLQKYIGDLMTTSKITAPSSRAKK
ncbi:hypothetical protein QBC43DRAFT_8948 [Cladorrhinum sp. PSN259]|nr:hypothetical protein QBC43DRAFT_8948 [Cladorrhinum sp. PSN259]